MTGCPDWNDINKQEADWLCGELHVPCDMAFAVARGRFTRLQARQRLGVRAAMLDWHIDKTGAPHEGRTRAGATKGQQSPTALDVEA